MDTEKFQKNDTPEAQKVQEGTSRRKLLMAGAAALPVMVTIKSTSAEAAGLTATPATWWWHGQPDEPEPPTQNSLLSSISCIQNIEMPWDYDGATKDVCHKENLDYSGWCDRKWGRGYSSLDNGIMPANYQLAGGGDRDRDRYRDNDEKCDKVYEYFRDGGRTNFWPGCKFDVSKERHCTYVQICLSTACWDSISTAVNINKNGLGDIG